MVSCMFETSWLNACVANSACEIGCAIDLKTSSPHCATVVLIAVLMLQPYALSTT